MKKNHKGFSLFELLAVLSIIGTVLFVMFGSYGNWGASHAIRGAADILYAGLTEAQTLAIEHQKVSCFQYGNIVTNQNQTITSFQTYLCFPTNENQTATDVEKQITNFFNASDVDRVNRSFYFKKWTPRHRLPGKVKISHVRVVGDKTEIKYGEENALFFRPNGTAFSLFGSNDHGTHYIQLETREIYTPRIGEKAEPLKRLFRIDLGSGDISEVDMKAGRIL